MTHARRLATRRSLAAFVAIGLPMVMSAAAGPVGRFVYLNPSWLNPALVGTSVAGAAAFVYFVFRWRPRCPQCRVARARFAWEKPKEYLTCAACGYREETGWTWE